ncbi:hypothetical protein N7448_000812 [Penicillium atrosanguineum]|uniref:Uncharacterized protein n=1 Tax=Penicillium atrosanguineum TaxID=1132637 RepID=A0A9W9LCZ2_9EURO|nr:Palmitoyltransferase pfa5 [Penicillium atrosanguineum]KAJ5134166.1 hypothetical protein N7526_005531 [Penicillium atrosanguineum]KAJ5149234.1 hypothetical protein N7448_000812 [Penicillium atrosanguineum]KAJ5304546.1 Palmitoyltransferase pfa5 [Penicillium atrosanguineum]KAJ5324015.1 hypothetical protein N7476_002615 [Penicillium atrosanguineum]
MFSFSDGTFNSAPDTPSLVYPDRLIRPLPKRTLRSRLSTDAADDIHYPPTPPASQIFYGVSGDSEEVVTHSKAYVRQTIETDRHELTPEADHEFETAVELDSGDEDGPVVVRRSAGFRGSLSPSSQPQGFAGKDGAKSSAGPDGYDAFENTNNKKKRKIPTPGNMNGHHSALSPEFASMGLASSNPPASDGSTGTYYGSGNPASPLGNGISGSGRGRLGRSTRSNSGRNPLSANAQNAWMNTRTPSRRDMSSPGPGESSDQGIISTAIANAANLSSPPRGRSNVSLLDQENNTTPTKTQFTFTCESDSSKGMAMQRNYSLPHRSPTSPLAPTSSNPRGYSTGTQTSPNMSQIHGQTSPGTQPPPAGDQGSLGRKKKRSPSSIYALSARQRKIQQQYTNIHHPPALEDIWICEFCEYESIFGHPPEALIRQYEIKDRKERKRLAEKKRLLEKAKMKGRKTKKAPKNAKNASQGSYQQGYDRASVDHSSTAGSGLHDDEYSHEYDDDEPGSIPAPDPASPSELKPPLPPPANIARPVPAGDATEAGTSRPA